MTRESIINVVFVVAIPAIAFIGWVSGDTFYLTLASRIAILSLAVVGLNIALGLGGLISFGHAAFFGIGGYVAAVLSVHAATLTPLVSWPIEINGTSAALAIWVVAVSVAAIVALMIGIVSLRTSGAYFIMITLAFAQMIYYFAISWPNYGGEDGMSIPARAYLPGVNTAHPMTFFLVCYVVLVIGLVAFAMIQSSRFGAALQAARQNDRRVAAVGIRVFPIRLAAFVISAMFTALAGALLADLNRFTSPSMLSWHLSGELMVLLILGGNGRLLGPVAGTMVFVLIEYALGGVTDRWQFFLGIVLLAIVLFGRGGIISLLAGRLRHG